jgi:hypothetical protein
MFTNHGPENQESRLSYSMFSLDLVRRRFGLEIVLQQFFPDNPAIVPTDLLRASFARASTIALISEKARSEFIVAPILLETKEYLQNTISIYSGISLDVAPAEGLQGVCDFIVSKAPPLPTLQAPLIMMVEAKKNDIEEGLGQCAAEMVAAQRFNQGEVQQSSTVYGCVTTGELWQFLKLSHNTLYIDPEKVYIEHVDKILGMLVRMAS